MPSRGSLSRLCITWGSNKWFIICFKMPKLIFFCLWQAELWCQHQGLSPSQKRRDRLCIPPVPKHQSGGFLVHFGGSTWHRSFPRVSLWAVQQSSGEKKQALKKPRVVSGLGWWSVSVSSWGAVVALWRGWRAEWGNVDRQMDEYCEWTVTRCRDRRFETCFSPHHNRRRTTWRDWCRKNLK